MPVKAAQGLAEGGSFLAELVSRSRLHQSSIMGCLLLGYTPRSVPNFGFPGFKSHAMYENQQSVRLFLQPCFATKAL